MEDKEILCPVCGDVISSQEIAERGGCVCKNCGSYLEMIDDELICVEDDDGE